MPIDLHRLVSQTNMSGLRPLQLPLMVEQWRKQEEEAAATASIIGSETTDDDAVSTYHHIQQNLLTTEPAPSELVSPVTPTFSARGHLRYSSSMSSFELSTPASCEDLPSSPTQALQTPCKRILDDVEEEEPFEYDRFNNLCIEDLTYDDVSEHLDLYGCLCKCMF